MEKISKKLLGLEDRILEKMANAGIVETDGDDKSVMKILANM